MSDDFRGAILDMYSGNISGHITKVIEIMACAV